LILAADDLRAWSAALMSGANLFAYLGVASHPNG
jgi:hypothetical protein